MKKKNGFIAISIVYSFFAAFLLLLILIITSYVNSRERYGIYINDIKQKVVSKIDDTQPIHKDQYVDEYIDYTTEDLQPETTLNFTYQGSVKSITLPAGTYQLEVWGAGVNATNGANGGYSKGTITFSSTQVLYLAVGQAGTNDEKKYDKRTFNGGGAGGYIGVIFATYQASGGGATHIATASGELSSLVDNKAAILIVAGGGAGWHMKSYTYTGGVGHGGGLDGLAGGVYQDGSYISYTPGSGGTQTAGGTGAICKSTDTVNGSAGSFGQGGDGSLDDTAGGSGGGGGYYGGGGGCYNYYYDEWVEVLGSGGSGYISPSLTNASTTQETTSTSPGADKNGYIRITML